MKEPLNFEIFTSDNPEHYESALMLQSWSEGEQMLPLSPEKLASHVIGMLAFQGANDSKELVGYRAVTEIYENGQWYEIGGLVVAPELRGQGIGQQIADKLFEAAQAKFANASFVIFANPTSVGISKKHGFKEATTPNEIPAVALGLCQNCPKFQSAKRSGKVCCDTIMVLTTNEQ